MSATGIGDAVIATAYLSAMREGLRLLGIHPAEQLSKYLGAPVNP